MKVPEFPQRARVFLNGDIVLGQYVGDVMVYAIAMPDGSLLSNTLAEVPPIDIGRGGTLLTIENNPKIVLDSGETVYGCQVWWEPVPELN